MAEEHPIFFVRTAAAQDVPAIIQLVKASWARTYDPVIGVEARKAKSDAKHVPDLFLGEIARRDAISLIALDKTDIIGHIGGEMRGAETFFVDHLHVDPAWHGKGVAIKLIDRLRSELGENTCTRAKCIELTVLSNNERAISFYRKVGFVPAKGTNEDEGLGGVPSILMRLGLK